ncbi:MAG: NirD/YgiW/YdeI family stress tolerance protein [Spirochaetaceae bacterium]|jgi:uncharacterized protein (TIGR00156 family)|nr:NirD/YgiW/YdeI family stress tolerance protein [Spirochaetaceae bacterium]
MKKPRFLSISILAAILSATTAYSQGLGGRGAGLNAKQIQTVTVTQAKELPDDTLVILTGSIVQSLGRERYTFRDTTGDIVIEIDNDLLTLLNLAINPGDLIEIGGKTDIKKRTVEIEVQYIRKH